MPNNLNHPPVKAQQLKEDYQAVMKTAAGKRLIAHFIQRSNLLVSTWTTDPSAAAYNEGRRGLGITIMNELNTCVPGGFIEVLKILEKEENNGH